MEERGIVDLSLFQLGFDDVKSLVEIFLVTSGKRKQETRVDADCLNCEAFCREVTAFDQEHFPDV